MAGEVLRELYVDLIARNVQQATDDVRRVTGQFEEATKSVRRYRDAIADANRTGIDGRVLSRGPGGVVTATRPVQPTAAVMAARPMQPPPQTRLPAAESAGGGLAALAGTLGKVGAAAGVAVAALAPLIGLVASGFQGTTEIEQLGRAMLQVSREAAAVFAPALRMVTNLINGVTQAFRGTGVAGQQLITGLSGLTVLLRVIDDPAIRQAMATLGAAFTQLLTAAKPLINLVANIGTELIKAFAVRPLLDFIAAMTVFAKVVERVTQLAARGASVLGLGGLMRDPRGPRQMVTLNQTGTEDAQGTFQRIQEAVLKAGQPQEAEPPDLKFLRNIDQTLTNIERVIGVLTASAGKVMVDPARLAEGAVMENPAVRVAAGAGLSMLLGRR